MMSFSVSMTSSGPWVLLEVVVIFQVSVLVASMALTLVSKRVLSKTPNFLAKSVR
jgi:hypothetical protein